MATPDIQSALDRSRYSNPPIRSLGAAASGPNQCAPMIRKDFFKAGHTPTLFAAFLVPVMSAIGFQGTTFGDADFQWFGFLVGNIANLEGNVAAIGVVVLCVVLLVLASLFQRRYVETNWIPGGTATPEPPAPAAEVPAHGAA
mgnify:CR=1 FL=1